METIPSEILEQAVQLLGNSDLSQEQAGDDLVTLGVDDMIASRLSAFIPEAFGAVLVSHMEGNLKFPSTFLARDRKGTSEAVLFASEPIFMLALNRAQTMYHEGPPNVFKAIALRSSAVKLINEALSKGMKFDSSTIAIAFGIPAEIYQKPKMSLWRRIFG
jgi:hypothetical protein